MNEKRFLSAILIGIAVILVVGLVGYFALRSKNLPMKAFPSVPLDTALVVVNVLSVEGEVANVQIDEIRDYHRYPEATYQKLEVGDKINTRVYHLAASGDITPPVSSLKPEIGKKYLADMSYCLTDYVGELSCDYEGWSSSLYPL